MNLLNSVSRFVSWHRRAFAAVLAALAVSAVAMAASPPPPATRPVAVAARALTAGTTVTDRDVTLRELPQQAVPEGVTTEPDGLVGLTTSVALAEGTILQEAMFASARQAAEGRSLVPVLVNEPQLRDLLAPGTPISLVHAEGTGSEVLTSQARVAALPAAPERQGLAAGPSGSALVLVDVPSDVAPAVSVLGQAGGLSVILGGR